MAKKKGIFKSPNIKTQQEIINGRAKGIRPREGQFLKELGKLGPKAEVSPSEIPKFNGAKEIVPKEKPVKVDFDAGFGGEESEKEQGFIAQMNWNRTINGIK